MAELVKDLVLVSLGMGIGVVLMCIAQVSKMADEQMEEIKKQCIAIVRTSVYNKEKDMHEKGALLLWQSQQIYMRE